MTDLIAALSWDKDDYGMADLRTLCEGCPGCILAAIRQSGMMQSANGDYIDFKFEFKKELEAWWATANETKHENDIHF